MALEIERKFLIKSKDYRIQASSSFEIIQGYLTPDPERSVRVRLQGNVGTITVKGKSSNNGLSRFEWEKEISSDEAKALLALCLPHHIEKTRHLIKFKGRVFEVDEFKGVNMGLVLAEIELNSENELFEKPEWLGTEVTGNAQYYNAYLSQNPYSDWRN